MNTDHFLATHNPFHFLQNRMMKIQGSKHLRPALRVKDLVRFYIHGLIAPIGIPILLRENFLPRHMRRITHDFIHNHPFGNLTEDQMKGDRTNIRFIAPKNMEPPTHLLGRAHCTYHRTNTIREPCTWHHVEGLVHIHSIISPFLDLI